jgi:hypothetical protein
LVLIAMALTPEHALEFRASAISVAVTLAAYFVKSRWRKRT